MNGYFDGEDYNQSIKFSEEMGYFTYVDPERTNIVDFYVKQNFAVLYDNYITSFFNPPKNLSFNNIDYSQSYSKGITK